MRRSRNRSPRRGPPPWSRPARHPPTATMTSMWTLALICFSSALQAPVKPARRRQRAPAPRSSPPPAIRSSSSRRRWATSPMELFKDRAPVSVENFLRYVNDGFYPGTIFHRVVRGFVVQGGGYTAGMVEKQTRTAGAERGHQRLEEHPRHCRDGADAGASGARRRSFTSTSPTTSRSITAATRRSTSATRCSAGS